MTARHRRGRGSNGERGAAAVEFALIAGILFTLVFGIIEFGQFFSQYEVFLSSAREGARTAAIHGTVAQVVSRVDAAADPYSRNGSVSVSVSGSSGDPRCDGTIDTIGKQVTVSWPQTFQISVPLLPPINKTVTVKGVFECE